jgi:hydroxypyruvate isomerase
VSTPDRWLEKGSSPLRIKQSLCYPIFLPKGMTLDDLFRTAAGVGYAAIELWNRGDDLEVVVETAKRHKLVVSSMCGHTSIQDGLNKRSNHDRIEDELKTSIDLAVKYGIPGLITFSGNRQPFQTDLEAIDACVDGLRRVVPYAERCGINLNMELLNTKVDHPGYQCDHTVWGVSVCEKVNSPRAKLLFDIYHMQIMEGDLIRTIQANIKWIGHFHTAGNPGRRDMDDTQELDYVGICREIASTGYDLYVGHEFMPKADVIQALRTAFELCNQG